MKKVTESAKREKEMLENSFTVTGRITWNRMWKEKEKKTARNGTAESGYDRLPKKALRIARPLYDAPCLCALFKVRGEQVRDCGKEGEIREKLTFSLSAFKDVALLVASIPEGSLVRVVGSIGNNRYLNVTRIETLRENAYGERLREDEECRVVMERVDDNGRCLDPDGVAPDSPERREEDSE